MTPAHTYTLELKYSKYAYQLTIDNSADDVVTYVKSKFPRQLRTMNRDRSTNVYCHKPEYELLMQLYGDRVIRSMAPINDEAGELLKQGVKLQIRDSLFYGTFRYRVEFYCGGSSAVSTADLEDWISETFGLDRRNKDWRLRRSYYFPNLYCASKDMVDMVMLTEPARIITISKIYTPDEATTAGR